MVKEIYTYSEDFGGLYIHVITQYDFFRVLEKLYYYYDENRPTREFLKKFWHNDIVNLDRYGCSYEETLLDLISMVDAIDCFVIGDYAAGEFLGRIPATDLFKRYSDFCAKHNKLGNILLIG